MPGLQNYVIFWSRRPPGAVLFNRHCHDQAYNDYPHDF